MSIRAPLPAPCSRWQSRTPTQTRVASLLCSTVSPVLTNALSLASSERDPARRSRSTRCRPLAEVGPRARSRISVDPQQSPRQAERSADGALWLAAMQRR